MKRIYKTIIAALLFLCMCISLSGCFYSFENSADGKFSFGVSKSEKDVFCIGYNWDGGDTSFVIPDEFMGYKVTTLGGYTGRGYPCPFSIHIDLSDQYPGNGNYAQCGESFFEENHLPDDEYDILTFSVRLGVNLVHLDYIQGKSYLLQYPEEENGKADFLCKIVYSFTVDENNPKLYTENGRLFYRENHEPVTDFFYE